MTRPVYGLTVLRYEDGRTEVVSQAIDDTGNGYVDAPSDWRLRHAMLIDALAEVKREAGIEPSSNPGQLEREGER